MYFDFNIHTTHTCMCACKCIVDAWVRTLVFKHFSNVDPLQLHIYVFVWIDFNINPYIVHICRA